MKQYHYHLAPKKDKLKVQWMYIEEKYFEQPELLPEALFEYKNITTLSVRGWLKALPEDLAEKLPNLKKLSIAFLRSAGLPHNLGDCKHLEELSINKTDTTLLLPDSIQKLDKLKSIYLSGCHLEKIPRVLTKLKQLELLNLYGNIIKQSLAEKYYWKQLTQLNLANNQLQEIPAWVFLHQSLEHLYVGNNPLQEIPTVIGQLQKMRFFSCISCQLQALPTALADLPHLYTISWDNNPFGYVTPVIFQLPLQAIATNKYYRYTGEAPLNNVSSIVNAMHKIFTKKGINTKENPVVETTCHLINQSDDLKTIPLQHLLDTYAIGNPALKELAWKAIFIRLQPFNEKEFDSSSQLLVLGKTIQTKKTIKESLQALHISITNKVTPKTTHVLLGKNIKKLAPLQDTHLVALDENQLNRFLDTYAPAYLVEESETKAHTTLQLKNLLASFELDNINIALNLMKTGGVPKELLTLIFAIHKFHPDATVVRQTKKLLSLNGSPTLVEKLKKRFQLKKYSQGYYSIKEYIDFICLDTAIDSLELTRYILIFSKYEYPYNAIFLDIVKTLSEKLQAEELQYYWDNRIKDGAVSILSGDNAALAALYKREDVTKLLVYNAGRLNARYPIAGMKNLHTLILSHSVRKFPLPKDLGQLQNLKVLQLINIIGFDAAAWQQIYALPNLEELHLAAEQILIAPEALQIPTIKKLVLSGRRLRYDLPIGQMKTLEEVMVNSNVDENKELLFEQLEQLPLLQKVHLPNSLQAAYNHYKKS